jgi:hypothetical protein
MGAVSSTDGGGDKNPGIEHAFGIFPRTCDRKAVMRPQVPGVGPVLRLVCRVVRRIERDPAMESRFGTCRVQFIGRLLAAGGGTTPQEATVAAGDAIPIPVADCGGTPRLRTESCPSRHVSRTILLLARSKSSSRLVK